MRFANTCALVFGISFLLATNVSAADKSGVSAGAISLPKGPGSIEGLGESFQPSLNTGTAKYSIKVAVPPGTAGQQPSLALTYDGGAGNGPLGYGWSISVPFVQRRTDKGIPTYGEDLGVNRIDTFITDGREELVPTTDGFYFCENESSFIRYRDMGDHWEGTAPDGTRLEFGLSADGRISDGARVFSWLLQKQTDTHGNVTEFFYSSFPGEHNIRQKYLSEIRYGPGSSNDRTAFHFLRFEYEDRKDWFEDARSGFLVLTGKRLKSIQVATQGLALTNHLQGDFNLDGTPDYLNRRYDLTYLNYAGDTSHWSLLASVRVIGADGTTSQPPATFNYAVSNPAGIINASTSTWTSANAPIHVVGSPQVDLIDLNSDGLPDLLKTDVGGNGHTVSVNLGPDRQSTNSVIRWSDPVAVDPGSGTSANFDLASERTHLADMDGDGLADLVHKSLDDAVFYFANQGKLRWSERRDMTSQESSPPAPFGNPNVRTADLDFDKRIDVVQSIDSGSGVSYRIWFNLGNQQYASPKTTDPVASDDFATPGVQIADCNGDRVPDLARIRPGFVKVSAGLGYGRFANPINIPLPDITLDDEQIPNIKLADLNGDGLADLVLERAVPGACWYWLNLGNYTFDTRRQITSLPAVSSSAAVRWADLNGNGTTDLIYGDSTLESRLEMVELGDLISGGLMPNLITEIGNGIGRTTKIEYAPSTRFALSDAAAGRPWPDPVPFPVSVVAGVTVSDSLGHEYRTEYLYHDGYYDFVEKQFRGFAEVEQHEIGDPFAPTLVARSHFDTGRFFDAMKGQLLVASTETDQGAIFSRETTTWANPPRTIFIGTNGTLVRFAHPIGKVQDILELGAGTPRRLESETVYDNYGNITTNRDFGVVIDGDRSAFDDERIVTTDFAINPDKWILRAPYREIVQDENGAISSRSESFYDDPTFSGNNPRAISTGNLTLRRDWIGPTNQTAFVNSARTRFDKFGNPIALLDPLANPIDFSAGHVREITFDPVLHAHPVSEIIHIGDGKPTLISSGEFDAGFGVITRSTDLNGNVTTYTYDGLGRIISVIKPGDSAEYPTTLYHYKLGVPAAFPGHGATSTGIVNYIETLLLDRPAGTVASHRDHYFISRQYSDGLGAELMTRTEAEPAPGSSSPRVAVTGAVLFNTRRKQSHLLNPFFTTVSGTLDEMLEFENIESPNWSGQFHLDGQSLALNLQNAHLTHLDYDATLRVIRSTNPDGSFSHDEFEPLLVREFDENDTDPASPHHNTPSIRFTDGLGRLVRVDELVRLTDEGHPTTNVQTWTTAYRYDLNNSLTRITDSQGNVKEIHYDGLGRKLWMNDPDAGISSTQYDDAGNIIETLDAKQLRTTYTYDGANRLLSEDYHDENSTAFSYDRSPDVRYIYDTSAAIPQGDGTFATAQNTKGTLTSIEDTSGAQHSSFDQRGRLAWLVKQLPDPLLDPQFTLQPHALISFKTAYSYDSLDRLTTLVYPDNDRIAFEFNARSQLQSISGTHSGSIVSSIAYLASEQLHSIVFGNDVVTGYEYDSRQRMNRLFTWKPEANREFVHFGYHLDSSSNIRAIQDRRLATTVPLENPRRNTQRFSYDDLYRLTRSQYGAGPTGPVIDFRYDRIGNMVEQSSDIVHQRAGLSVTDLGEMHSGGSLGSWNRHGRAAVDEPGPHALSLIQNGSSSDTNAGAQGFSYDSNGNVTNLSGLQCTWDARDRLVTVENNSMRADYRYDFSGQRVLKRVTWKSSTNEFGLHTSVTLYPNEYFEVRDNDQPVKYIFMGENRIARVTGSLSTEPRLQRLRLFSGWNLVSLAVGQPGLHSLLQSGEVLRLTTSGEFSRVNQNEQLPAGTILWVNASTNRVLSLRGVYSDPANTTAPLGNGFFAPPGLEGWTITKPSIMSLAAFHPSSNSWHTILPGFILPPANSAFSLAPGSVAHAIANLPTDISLPDPKLRIQYYHGDHLGSANVITDSEGNLVEESTFYPYGETRTEFFAGSRNDPYDFTQKERDGESGLHYYDARFLNSTVARFLSPDPKYVNPDALDASELQPFLANPQMLNLYSYALNNPVRYNDPTGLDAKDRVAWGNDAIGVVAGAADEIDTYKTVLGKGFKTGVGAGGKVTTGVSVAWKAGEFIADPSSATGGQLINEGAKTLTSIVLPPVGLIWSILDLTGYGPSAILEHTEKSIQAKRKATAAYQKATAYRNHTAHIYYQGSLRIEARQYEAKQRLKVLEKKTAKVRATAQKVLKGDTRSLAELNAAVARAEARNRRTAREMHRVEAYTRKVSAQ